MPRSLSTLILITGDRWVRADLTADDSVDVQQGDAIDAPIEQQVNEVLVLTGKPGKRVWVISDRLWLGEVDIPPRATVGMSDADLSDAAGFEAEAAEGLPAVESCTAFTRVKLDGEERFLVTQAPRDELIVTADSIKKQGGALAGLLHPAGLAKPIGDMDSDSSPSQAWSRVEFWADGIVVVNSSRKGCVVHTTGMLPTVEWRRAVKPLIDLPDGVDIESSVSFLAAPGVKPRGGATLTSTANPSRARWAEPVAQADEPSALAMDLTDKQSASAFDLQEERNLERFATLWLQQLASGHSSTAMVRKPKLPSGPLPQIVVGVAAALVVLMIVGVQFFQNQTTVTELRGLHEHASEDAQMLSQLKSEVRQLGTQIKRVESEHKRLAAERDRVAQERERKLAERPETVDMQPYLAELLSALADASDGQQVVQSVTAQSPTHRIEGIAVSSAAATRFAQQVGEQLREHWVVHPAEISPVAGSESMAWQFNILVEPIGSAHRSSKHHGSANSNQRLSRDR